MGLCLSKDAAAATAAGASGGPMEADAAKAWFVTAVKPQPDAMQRLLCLPWEGGSSLAFNHWLVPFTEVVAVELPGRMGRMKEPLCTRVEAIVQQLAQAMLLVGYINEPSSLPLVLFGHGYLGGVLALELAKVLVQQHNVQPHALIVSGCPAPQELPRLYPTKTGLAGLKADKLAQYLVETGAIVSHVASNKETMRALLPLYRADLGAVDAYVKQQLGLQTAAASPATTPSLHCPVLAVHTRNKGSLEEGSVMEGWQAVTTGAFEREGVSTESSGSSTASSGHYAYLRNGGTDALLRAVARVTLGRSILMKDVVAARRWFVSHHSTPKPDQARYRMLCLAWAGGNSQLFKTWKIPGIEILAVELPGRNARVKEAPLKSFPQIVARTVQAIEVLGYADDEERPLVLFGHSFGAMQTLEIARLLRARGHSLPHYLILSGCPPSDDGWGDTGVSSKTDDGIGKYLVWLGGLTPELAANKEIMAKVLPIIRGDYTAIDNYQYSDAPPLDTRVLALTGENDMAADEKSMGGWARFVADPQKQFSQIVFGGGGHFFIKDRPDAVLKAIEEVVVKGKPVPEGKA